MRCQSTVAAFNRTPLHPRKRGWNPVWAAAGAGQTQRHGYRQYDGKDTERLGFIRSARTLGFSLTEIAQILAVHDRHEPPCQHVMDLIRVHMDEVEIRMRELLKLKRDLAALYQAGQDLPEDVQMRSCVCHLIRVRVSGGAKGQ